MSTDARVETEKAERRETAKALLRELEGYIWVNSRGGIKSYFEADINLVCIALAAARLPRSGDGASGEGALPADLAPRPWSAREVFHEIPESSDGDLPWVIFDANGAQVVEFWEHYGENHRQDHRLVAEYIVATVNAAKPVAPPPASDASPAEGREALRDQADKALSDAILWLDAGDLREVKDCIYLAQASLRDAALSASPAPAPMADKEPLSGNVGRRQEEPTHSEVEPDGRDSESSIGQGEDGGEGVRRDAIRTSGVERRERSAHFERRSDQEVTANIVSPAPMAGETPQSTPARSIELLLQWRDYWRAHGETGRATMAGDAAYHLTAAQKQQDEAVKALEPFASRADAQMTDPIMPDISIVGVTMGDLRRARKALASLQGTGT